MEQNESNSPTRKGKHVNRNERILIESLLTTGMAEFEIGVRRSDHRRLTEVWGLGNYRIPQNQGICR